MRIKITNKIWWELFKAKKEKFTHKNVANIYIIKETNVCLCT